MPSPPEIPRDLAFIPLSVPDPDLEIRGKGGGGGGGGVLPDPGITGEPGLQKIIKIRGGGGPPGPSPGSATGIVNKVCYVVIND